MTNEEALTILEKSEKCYTEDCPDVVFCDECPWNVKTAEYDEAIETIKSVLSKQCASSEQVGKSVIVDFVAFQREWLKTHKIMELNPVDEVMTEIFLKETGKAFIDSLGQTAENDEDRTRDNEGPKLFGNRTIIEPGEQFIGEDLLKKALDQSADSGKTIVLKKRTITERLIIAESLINSVIADSDQFREDAKKTDDVLINLPSAQPETIHCNSCKHWTQSTGKMKGYGLGRCDFHDADLVTCNGFCYWAERRNDE